MGKVQGGILGSVSAKVAGAVFYNLRGQQIVRKYAIPANSNSPAQRVQRDNFSAIVKLGKAVKSLVIDTYWSQRQKGKTTPAWGAFMSVNVKRYSPSLQYKQCVLSDGNLETPNSISGTATASSKTLYVQWDTHIVTNGAPSDIVVAVAYYKEADYFYFLSGATRDDHEIDLDLPAMNAGDHFYVWLTLHSSTNPKLWNTVTPLEIIAT